jgi:hypothetical protein
MRIYNIFENAQKRIMIWPESNIELNINLILLYKKVISLKILIHYWKRFFLSPKLKRILSFEMKQTGNFISTKVQGNKAFKMEYTYVWDGSSCLDNILQGWIPNKLIDILFSHMITSSQTFIKSLLSTWIAKLNNLFFNLIWKKRNDDMIS